MALTLSCSHSAHALGCQRMDPQVLDYGYPQAPAQGEQLAKSGQRVLWLQDALAQVGRGRSDEVVKLRNAEEQLPYNGCAEGADCRQFAASITRETFELCPIVPQKRRRLVRPGSERGSSPRFRASEKRNSVRAEGDASAASLHHSGHAASIADSDKPVERISLTLNSWAFSTTVSLVEMHLCLCLAGTTCRRFRADFEGGRTLNQGGDQPGTWQGCPIPRQNR